MVRRIISSLIGIILIVFCSGALTYCKPKAVISVDVKSGNAPLTVNFDASESTVWNKKPAPIYKWDLDGDGTIDAEGLTAQKIYTFPKNYEVKLIVTDSKGQTSEVKLTITVKIPIKITYPTVGNMTYGTQTHVIGELSDTSGLGSVVTVNDYPAIIYGNKFVVNHIPIGESGGFLEAKASNMYGATGSTFFGIAPDTICNEYLTIECPYYSGTSPFESDLKVTGSSGLSEMTLRGISGVEISNTPSPDVYHVKITGEGIYTVWAAALSKSGDKFVYGYAAFVVFSQESIDNELRKKWSDIRNLLLQDNTDAALDFFTITSKDKYSKIFSILKNELPDIMNSMSDLELIYIKDSEAKYRMKRGQVINGKSYDITYYVYFFQDPFGFWHLDSF